MSDDAAFRAVNYEPMVIEKLLKPRTLKEKIFSGFYIYSVLSFFVAFTSFNTFREMEDTDKAVMKINQLYNLTLNMARYGEQFLAYETTNEEFFAKGKSDILNQQFQHLKKVRAMSDEIQQAKGNWKLYYAKELVRFDSLLNTYDETFKEIISSIKYKGFKDYGLLGYMNEQVKLLEASRYIDKELLMKLRNQEKDYMIRGGTSYLYEVRRLSGEIKMKLEANPQVPEEEKFELKEDLRRYNSIFLKVVEEDMKVGYKMNKGLVPDLVRLTEEISELVTQINEEASGRKDSLYDLIRMGIVSATTISVVLLLVLSVSFNLIHRSSYAK
ncbi:hypothetical protein V6R21_22130 [Limibacter armeniacum]|uniref:hypothetical protein n=1 Tax=Limibacter armeniacum TaxID=466084 RepID=UPI002FE54ABB